MSQKTNKYRPKSGHRRWTRWKSRTVKRTAWLLDELNRVTLEAIDMDDMLGGIFQEYPLRRFLREYPEG